MYLLAKVNLIIYSTQSRNPGGGGEARSGYSLTKPIRVCATQRGRDFGTPDLKRGIHIRDIF